jgi:site-specific DNA-cytosine methylase
VKPLAIDLFAGIGGWMDGLLTEGFRVIGFDIERHSYDGHEYPAQLVLQDVLTLHGYQLRHAALIVASPPCQKYSYMRATYWSIRTN